MAGPPGPNTPWIARFRSLSGLFEVIVLFGLVIGGLFAGLFTPTQAAGIGVAGALLIAIARKQFTWKKFYAATKDGLLTSCMIIFIIASAAVFGHFIAVSTLPIAFAELAGELNLPPVATMIIIVVIYLIGGCFIDLLPLVLLTVPTFYPIVTSIGYDPIWFGIIIVLISEAGALTPPVGINAFVVHGIARDIPLGTIFRGAYPFLAMIILTIILIFIFPQIVTFLPSFTSY